MPRWRCSPRSPSGSAGNSIPPMAASDRSEDPAGAGRCRSAPSRSCGPTSRGRWGWPGRSAPGWDAVNAPASRARPRGRGGARRTSSSGPRATPCSRSSREAGAAVRGGGRCAAGARRARTGRRRPGPGPDRAPLRRGAPRRRRLRRLRRQPRGSDRGGRARWPDRPVRPDRRAGRRRSCPAGTSIRTSGRFVLKDVPGPERLLQLDVEGLPTEFPPLRAGRTDGRQPRPTPDQLHRSRPRARRTRATCSTRPDS